MPIKSELDKANKDLLLYGQAFMKDGKHMPIDDVFLQVKQEKCDACFIGLHDTGFGSDVLQVYEGDKEAGYSSYHQTWEYCPICGNEILDS